MGRKLIDLTGCRFGHLTVVGRVPSRNRATYWHCQCDCGSATIANGASMRRGRTVSCGCWRSGWHHRKGQHGQSGGREYSSWRHMIQRCNNPSHHKWAAYGGRGITVCDRWVDFRNFLADMGERPSNTTLDRINNDGGYEPGNCRWATSVEQTYNRRPRRQRWQKPTIGYEIGGY